MTVEFKPITELEPTRTPCLKELEAPKKLQTSTVTEPERTTPGPVEQKSLRKQSCSIIEPVQRILHIPI